MIDPFENIRPFLQEGNLAAARDGLLKSIDRYGDLPSFKALYGQVLLRCEQIEEGTKLIEEVSQVKPETAIWATDLAVGLFLLGNIRSAKEKAELALTFVTIPAAAFNLLGAISLGENNLEKAENYFNKALLREPNRPEILSNLGGLAVRQGKLSEALVYYDRALELNHQLPQAVTGRNAMLVSLERAPEAVLDLEERISIEPKSVSLNRHLAYLLEAAGRFDEACSTLKTAYELDEKCVDTLLQFAAMVMGRSRYKAALWALLKAEELDSDSLAILNMLLQVYIELGRYEKAEEKVTYLFELYPDAPATLMARASLRSAQDDFIGAEDDLRTVIKLQPGSAEAIGSLAHILMQTGRISEAIKCLEKASEINPASLAGLIEARSFPDDPQTITKMRLFVDNPLTAKGPRAAMAFALIKLFEKKEEYDDAFQYAHKANELTRKDMSYDPQVSSKFVTKIKTAFSKDFFSRFNDSGIRTHRPIFVVGMPRSGTTLTEQILCSHPDIFGAGELGLVPAITRLMPRVLKRKIIAELGSLPAQTKLMPLHNYPDCLDLFKNWMAEHAAAYYLKNLYKINDSALRVVDKLPHNFLHLGIISVLFPKAKIIHVKRDFRDIAISNYFTNFKHKHGGMAYAFSLSDIGSMINDYRLIMDHWREVLPTPIFELSYEDLVNDQEIMARKLFDFIGIDWNSKVMDFHKTDRPVKTASVWQVRQPIYTTSTKRWQRYESFLTPLINVLDEYPEKTE